MTRGGARNRSGPQPDPNSERSERRGYKLTALPAQGYDGEIPRFPLLGQTVREVDLWEEVWRTPQACAWSMPSESWRIRSVAMYVRLSARCELTDAPASLLAQLHRFADQIGMTTAGLAEMGWKVAVDETAEKRDESSETAPAVRERRLRVAGDVGGA